MKLKGSFWISGGGEWNYRSRFENLSILKTVSQWQQSALLGIQKRYRLSKARGTASLLYDFLSQQQMPKTQPIIFRFGYQFK
jgi:hypothetical protein